LRAFWQELTRVHDTRGKGLRLTCSMWAHNQYWGTRWARINRVSHDRVNSELCVVHSRWREAANSELVFGGLPLAWRRRVIVVHRHTQDAQRRKMHRGVVAAGHQLLASCLCDMPNLFTDSLGKGTSTGPSMRSFNSAHDEQIQKPSSCLKTDMHPTN